MGVLFLIVFFLVSLMIVGLVLLQEGKGGGLTGMSSGMDGVMGAKNPLRRMTAYLFVFFVVMAVTINWYFHQRTDTSLPAGVALPNPVRVLEETAPIAAPVVDGDAAAPAEGVVEGTALPIPPETSEPEAPAAEAGEPAATLPVPADLPAAK